MSRRQPRARARARAGRRGGAGGRQELLGRWWRHRAAAAVPRRWRLLICEHRREDRENKPTQARGHRLNSFISEGLIGDRQT
jgi:hypothetical protein